MPVPSKIAVKRVTADASASFIRKSLTEQDYAENLRPVTRRGIGWFPCRVKCAGRSSVASVAMIVRAGEGFTEDCRLRRSIGVSLSIGEWSVGEGNGEGLDGKEWVITRVAAAIRHGWKLTLAVLRGGSGQSPSLQIVTAPGGKLGRIHRGAEHGLVESRPDWRGSTRPRLGRP